MQPSDDALRSKLLQGTGHHGQHGGCPWHGGSSLCTCSPSTEAAKDKGNCQGAEALVGWIPTPEWGFQSPGEFIPLFERNGFITRLGQYTVMGPHLRFAAGLGLCK
ncbi:MAG: hypothetical protein ACLTW9_30755 [Enterocloster sp.]